MQHPDTLAELMWQRQAEIVEWAERRRLCRFAVAAAPPRRPLAVTVDVRLPGGRHVRFGAGRTAGGTCS
jgi:hypothetical protein